MPNFLNSFKIDDFIDRKDKKTNRLLEACEANDFDKIKRGLLGIYIKNMKAPYLEYINQLKELEKKKEELEILEDKLKQHKNKKVQEDNVLGEAMLEYIEDLFSDVPVVDPIVEEEEIPIIGNQQNQPIQPEVQQVQVGQEIQQAGPVQPGVQQVQVGQEIQQAGPAQPAPPKVKTTEELIAEAESEIQQKKDQIAETEKQILKNKETIIKAGGSFDKDGKIEMQPLIQKMQTLSDKEKKKIGKDFTELLEKYEDDKYSFNWVDEIPWFNDFAVDFEERLELDEDEIAAEQVNENVKNVSEKLVQKVEVGTKYKGDIESIKAGAEKATDPEAKLWYAIAHLSKKINLSVFNVDYFRYNQINPKNVGLPGNLRLPREEDALIIENMDKAVQDLQIKDRSSALEALKKLAKIKTKLHYELGNECLHIENALQNEDLKDAKANFLVKRGISAAAIMYGSYLEIERRVKEKALEAIKAEIKISDNTTLEEFASIMGGTTEEKIKLFNQHGVKPSDKIGKVYGKYGNKHQDEALLAYSEKIYDDLNKTAIKEVQDSLGEKEREIAYRGEHVIDSEPPVKDSVWENTVGELTIEVISNEAKIYTFNKLNNVVTNGVTLEGKGLQGPAGLFRPPFKAGKKVEGQEKEQEKEREIQRSGSFSISNNANVMSIADQLIHDKRDDIRAKEHAEFIQKRSKNWEKRFHPDRNGKWDANSQFDDNAMLQIVKDTQLYLADPFKKSLVDLSAKMIPGPGQENALSVVGLDDVSMNMRSTQYVLWLMSEKGADIKTAMVIGAKAENRKAFLDFCAKNPSGEKGKYANIAEWTKVYNKAYRKLRDYKLPDIDYSDPTKVQEHMAELVVLSAIGENGSALMGKFFDGDNAKIIASNEIGQDNFNDIGIFMKGLESFTRPIRNAYINTPYVSTHMNVLEKQLMNIAVDRYLAGKRMDGKGGKTLDTVLEDKLVKNGNQYLNYQDEAFKIKVIDKEKYPDNKHVSRELAVEMLKIKGMKGRTSELDKIHTETMTGFSETNLYLNVMEFRDGLNETGGNLGYVQRQLLSNSSSALKLREFRKHEDMFNSVHKWLGKTMAPLIKGEMKATMQKNGLNISDLFLIDGKSPKQIFGEKYSFVTEPVEKEELIQLEILNAIYQGDKKVEIKNFRMDKDERLIENGTVKMFANKLMAEKMIVGAVILETGLKDIAEQLKGYKNGLMDALPPVEGESRREKEERFLNGGTGLYKDMAQALNRAITIVGDKDAKPEDIRKALIEFQNASKEYYKHRKGWFFSPRSDMGRDRLKVAESARKGMLNIIMQYDNLRRGLNIDHTFGYHNKSVGESSLNQIEVEIFDLNKRFKKIYDMHVREREQDGKAKAQNIKGVTQKQMQLLNHLISENSGHIKMDYRKTNVDDMVKDKPGQTMLQTARNYICKKYIDDMLRDGNSPEDIQKLIDNVKDGKLRQQVFDVMSDEAFVRIVNENPQNYYSEMRKHEAQVEEQKKRAKADKIVAAADKLLERAKHAGYANYIKAPGKNVNALGQKDMEYYRLASIAMAQILTTPEYKHLAYTGKLGSKELKDAQNTLKKQLEENKILDKMSNEKLDQYIKNGSFKNYTIDMMMKNVKKTDAMEKNLGVKVYDQIQDDFKAHKKNYDVDKSSDKKVPEVKDLVLPETKKAKKKVAENKDVEVKRSNSMVIKGENKGKVKGRKRANSMSKKDQEKKTTNKL